MTDKRLRIGTDDFAKIRRENGYFVDKSPLIREVIDGSDVLLLPRPRRFGKTLNLSMLRYFFERTESEDRRELFEGLAIEQDAEAMTHYGRYPTVFLTLKNVKGRSWQETRKQLRTLIATVIDRFREAVRALPPVQAEQFERIRLGTGDDADLKASLSLLITAAYRFYGEPVVLLLDEYDSPVIEAFHHGYLDEMLDFLRAWLGAGLKHEDGPALFRAVVTGILRIAKESIFSGLNNLKVWSTLVPGRFADKFGFTEPEVEQLLADYDCADKMPEVREWYNGYSFGGTVIYNPWSVLNYVDNLPAPAGPQWLNTASNRLIHEEMAAGGAAIRRDLEKLLAGEELRYPIREDTVFGDVGRSPETIWSFLYFAGYLRAEDPRPDPRDRLFYRLSIPNREVRIAYREFVERTTWRGQSADLDEFLNAFLKPDPPDRLEPSLSNLVLALLSHHDPAHFPEAVYHAFVLGLLANLRSIYDIRSEAETGYGRADILMIPKTPDYPLGYVIEFKALDAEADIDAAVAAAFEQIEAKAYAARLLEAGVASENIRKLAIVVRGKDVRVAWRGAAG